MRHDVPTQSCVLAHVTTTMALMRQGAPVDLVFQSIGGTDDLLRIVGSVRLLGVQCIVSGIRPAVAETLVQLGVDLARVVTVATLHAALRMCMTQTATGPRR